MELKDTVAGMLSEDYKERFKAEYQQLKIRATKLRAMLCNWLEGRLNFDPVVPSELLVDQLTAMDKYLTLLEARARLEGIEI